MPMSQVGVIAGTLASLSRPSSLLMYLRRKQKIVQVLGSFPSMWETWVQFRSGSGPAWPVPVFHFGWKLSLSASLYLSSIYVCVHVYVPLSQCQFACKYISKNPFRMGLGGQHYHITHTVAAYGAASHLGLVWFLVALFPIQIPANPLRKARKNGPTAWFSETR